MILTPKRRSTPSVSGETDGDRVAHLVDIMTERAGSISGFGCEIATQTSAEVTVYRSMLAPQSEDRGVGRHPSYRRPEDESFILVLFSSLGACADGGAGDSSRGRRR